MSVCAESDVPAVIIPRAGGPGDSQEFAQSLSSLRVFQLEMDPGFE